MPASPPAPSQPTISIASSDPLAHLSRTLAQHQTHLVRLYASLGHADPQTCAANKISDLHVGILDTIEAQAKEAEKEVAQLTHAVAQLTEQIRQLRIRLGHRDLEAQLEIPAEALVPKLQRIQNILNDLSQTKFDREILVENLLRRLESFAPILGDQFIQDAVTKSNQSLRIGQMFGANLSTEYISRLEKQSQEFELEVSRRAQLLLEHINEIFNLWGHLGISPASPSANPTEDHSDIDPIVLAHLGFKDVAVTVNGDIKPIGHCESVKMLPTTTNLEKVRARQTWLDAERQKREEQIQTWYDELCVLWARLGVPEDEQEQFVESWRGLSEQCVEGYEAELKRMVEAKKEHMVLFVQKERDSIIELWDQMYVAENERANVSIMYSDDYSEELLASHEKLKVQLLDDLSDKKVLLNLLNKYFTLLQEAHELEVAEKDPNRYAKGKRGDPGRLLREEKIRKRVTKEKPKLENDLKTLIPEWENERGRPFMVNGSRFLEDLVIRLEQEAALKTQASGRSKSTIPPAQPVKRQQTGNISRPGSPAKRTRTGETTRSKGAAGSGAIRGSANPFGTVSATPRPGSKAGSITSTTTATRQQQQKLAPQTTGASSVYNTRTRSHTHLARPPGALQYQRTGSSMSYYNPVTPSPMPRAPASAAPTELTATSEHPAALEEPAGSDLGHPAPSSRSVSAQSSCPGIPPGWPTTTVHPPPTNAHQQLPTQIGKPPPFATKKYASFAPPTVGLLGKGMPAPPLKKGIFRPRPSALPPPPPPPAPLSLIHPNHPPPSPPDPPHPADGDHHLPAQSAGQSRVVSGSSDASALDQPVTSFIDLQDHHQPSHQHQPLGMEGPNTLEVLQLDPIP
ncbi:hypothetical protein PTTG_28741 [Puccinia triticina 1-1 BBBD Race 1]|uniref:Microtubule associated protein n=1 Tax=Puccinia triticina (isolate 1-1 / race 1 (BBBD)) TaxID=630390 RepID=A0A180G9B2_PUCT1|nr:hypothetical protein PTTG_28741 [Puccinia triticina 1-1 BBBD Race 1]